MKEIKKKIIFNILSDKGNDKFDDSHGSLGLPFVEKVRVGRYSFKCAIDSLQYFFLYKKGENTCS